MPNYLLTGDLGKASMTGLFPSLRNITYFQKRVSRLTKKELYRVYENGNINDFKRISSLPEEVDGILIRFGTRITLRASITYNTNAAIKLASEKLAARLKMQQEDVRIPKTFKASDVSIATINNEPELFPLIARPLVHAQGKELYVVNSVADYKKLPKNIGYYSQFIPKDSEYRVHAAHGKILSVMRKPAPEDPTQVAWNRHQTEDPFTPIPWSEWNFDVCLQAMKAIKALGLDFGAVDVIAKDGIAYVLEVNTAPSLATSPYMLEKYANYFNWLCASATAREHFDFTQYKKVESLSWKGFDFEDRAPRPKASRS